MATVENIDFKIPEGWADVNSDQLIYIYKLLAADYSSTEVKLLCLLRFNKAVVLTRAANNGFWIKYQGKVFPVTPVQMAEVLASLEWVDSFPLIPVRPSSMGLRDAVSADFEGVPFGSFLAVDNYYYGYLQTHDEALIDAIYDIVYPRKSPLIPAYKPQPWQRVAIFYWIASLKGWLSRKYKNFFAPVAADGGNLLSSSSTPDIEGAMNAQIRALTKGDVTKEQQILEMDTLRALTELDAQAREYNEFNQKYGNK
ncbi:MAG: hypothetical protein NC217_07705 [Muribaculaceae bacterium]|nr:hypothetical protein [Muribaculaceae bacterium]